MQSVQKIPAANTFNWKSSNISPSSRFLNGTREHSHRNISKDKRVRSQAITMLEGPMLETLDYTIRIGSTPTFLYFDLYLYSSMAYDSPYFLAFFLSFFLSFLHSTPSPPFLRNTRGVKVPCSTSNTLCRYCLFSVSFFCSLKIFADSLFWLLAEFIHASREHQNML